MRATIARLAATLFCLFVFAAPVFAETELTPQQLERLEALYDKILADEVTSLSMDELREYFQLELALGEDEKSTIALLRVHLFQWSQHHDQKMEDVVAQLKDRPKPQFITVSYQPFPNFGNFNMEQFLNILPETFEGLDAVVMPDLVTLPNINFNFTNITQQLNGINQATTFSAVQAGLNPTMISNATVAQPPLIIPDWIGSSYSFSPSIGGTQMVFSGPLVVRLPDGRIADVIQWTGVAGATGSTFTAAAGHTYRIVINDPGTVFQVVTATHPQITHTATLSPVPELAESIGSPDRGDRQMSIPAKARSTPPNTQGTF